MADTVTGRVWRRSSADEIEADLAALWREVAREAPVSRAVMSNLVVCCPRSAGAQIGLDAQPDGVPVDQIASHHPARVILLHYDPEVCDPDAQLAAQVGLLLFGPRGARYGIEQIVIRSACAEEALPSIVRRYTLGDIPTSIWWTEDLSDAGPLASLVPTGRQLLFDSRGWRHVDRAVLALAPLIRSRFGPDLADVNWRRLTPVRQAILLALRPDSERAAADLTPIDIRFRADEAALAWLLAGWLQSAGSDRSGSAPGDGLNPPLVERAPEADADVLAASFARRLHLRLAASRVTVTDAAGHAVVTVPVPREDQGEAIAAELHTLTQDFALHAALTALIQRFSGS